jgi:hypothetical protein
MTPELEAALIEAEALLLEPREQFDPCIIGLGQRGHATFAIYDREKVIEALTEDVDPDDMDDAEESAVEHFDFNILGSWMGDGTPAFLTTFGDPS